MLEIQNLKQTLIREGLMTRNTHKQDMYLKLQESHKNDINALAQTRRFIKIIR